GVSPATPAPPQGRSTGPSGSIPSWISTRSTDVEAAAALDPPSTAVPDETACAALLERVMAASHTAPEAHVAVIGHHTLPFVLALLKRGCLSVRSLRPGAPAPDCEPVELAWIVDLHDQGELGDALRAARSRVGAHGRI